LDGLIEVVDPAVVVAVDAAPVIVEIFAVPVRDAVAGRRVRDVDLCHVGTQVERTDDVPGPGGLHLPAETLAGALDGLPHLLKRGSLRRADGRGVDVVDGTLPARDYRRNESESQDDQRLAEARHRFLRSRYAAGLGGSAATEPLATVRETVNTTSRLRTCGCLVASLSGSQMSVQRLAIVGAGPAGSALATLLAERGAEVTLFDDGRRPELVVGESLVPALVPILRRLGVEDVVAALGMLKPGVSFLWSATERFSFSFARYAHLQTGYAYNVPRKPFDQAILGRALAAGVQRVEARARLEPVPGNGAGPGVRIAAESLARA